MKPVAPRAQAPAELTRSAVWGPTRDSVSCKPETVGNYLRRPAELARLTSPRGRFPRPRHETEAKTQGVKSCGHPT